MKKLIQKEKGTLYKKMKYKLTIERMLFFLFITTFSLLVIVQAALTNPSVRTFLTSENELEGAPMEVEEFLYSEGTVSLKLMDKEADPDMRVLVNGETVAVFNTNIVEVDVKDGDVVEVDGSSSFNEVEVEIVDKSANVATECVGETVNIKSNIKKVTEIKVK